MLLLADPAGWAGCSFPVRQTAPSRVATPLRQCEHRVGRHAGLGVGSAPTTSPAASARSKAAAISFAGRVDSRRQVRHGSDHLVDEQGEVPIRQQSRRAARGKGWPIVYGRSGCAMPRILQDVP